MSVDRYRVIYLDEVYDDLDERTDYIIRVHKQPQGAVTWQNHVQRAAASLDVFPARRQAELPPPGKSVRPVYVFGINSDFIVYEVFEELGIVRVIAARSMVRRLMDVTDRLNFPPPE